MTISTHALQTKLCASIRRASTPAHTARKPCAVCDLHQPLTEAHHIVTVEAIAAAALKWHAVLHNAPMLWLCPTCHRAAHRLCAGAPSDPILLQFPERQMYRLAALAALHRVWTLELACVRQDKHITLDEFDFPVEPQNGAYGDGTEICKEIFFVDIASALQAALYLAS